MYVEKSLSKTCTTLMQFIVIFELLVGTPAEHLNIHLYKLKQRQYACRAQDVAIFYLKV